MAKKPDSTAPKTPPEDEPKTKPSGQPVQFGPSTSAPGSRLKKR